MSDVEFLSEPHATPPSSKPRRARWVAPLVAAVVVAGGGVGTYYALSSSESGSATPVEAVQAMVGDLEHSDFLGLLDDMAPGERTALEPGVKSDIDSLKRLGILSDGADASAVQGLQVSGSNLTFKVTTRVSDNVQVVAVNGGTLKVRGDASKLPLSDRVFKMIGSRPRATTQTINLAQHPMQVAAQQVDGHWYWSLFYTIANSSSPGRAPSDPIAPQGADSPTAAVKSMIANLAGGNWRSAIALLSPAELGAVQTYAGAALHDATARPRQPAQIENLQLEATGAADGYQQVTLKALTVRTGQETLSITRNGDCYRMATRGKSQQLCASEFGRYVQDALNGFDCMTRSFSSLSAGAYGSSTSVTYRNPSMRHRGGMTSYNGCSRAHSSLTAAQRTALTHLFQGLTDTGMETQEIDGKWYLAPVRTSSDTMASVLGHLTRSDFWALTRLGQ